MTHQQFSAVARDRASGVRSTLQWLTRGLLRAALLVGMFGAALLSAHQAWGATIVVNSTPTAAQVWYSYNGGAWTDLRVITPTTLVGLPAGQYALMLKKAGYPDLPLGTQTLTAAGSLTFDGTMGTVAQPSAGTLRDSGPLYLSSCTVFNGKSADVSDPNAGKCEYRYVYRTDHCSKVQPCDNLMLYFAAVGCSAPELGEFLRSIASTTPNYAVACAQPLAPGHVLPLSLGAPERDEAVISHVLRVLKDPAGAGVWNGKNLLLAGSSQGASRYPVVAARYADDARWLGSAKTAACMSDGVVDIGYQDRFIAEGPGGLSVLSCEYRHTGIISGYTVRSTQPAAHTCDPAVAGAGGHDACNPRHSFKRYAGDCNEGDCVSFDSIVGKGESGWSFAPGVSASSFAVRHWKLIEEGSSFENTQKRCEKDVAPAEPLRALCDLIDQDPEHRCTFVARPLDAHSAYYYTQPGNFKSECIGWFDSIDDSSAQDAVKRRLAQLVAPYVDRYGAAGKSVGLVIGVATPALRSVQGYGATTLGGTAAPNALTLFEIGSLTKAYTGVTLGLLANRGVVKLTDTTETHFPRGVPRYPVSGVARAFRLVDLATHTSGLPHMPSNLHYPPTYPNPAAGYTIDDLGLFLATYDLTRPPGLAYLYSNAGAGTLGHVLSRAAGRAGFDDLIRKEIAQPMGLVDTVVAMSAEQRSRRIQGYLRTASGLQAAPENSIGEGLQGAGALRSTGEDVLKFVEGALGRGPADVVAAWSQAVTPRVALGSRDYGRTGLLIDIDDVNGHTVYSKSGATAGFSTQMIFTTSPPAAVVLLSNTAGADLRELGHAVLDELLK